MVKAASSTAETRCAIQSYRPLRDRLVTLVTISIPPAEQSERRQRQSAPGRPVGHSPALHQFQHPSAGGGYRQPGDTAAQTARPTAPAWRSDCKTGLDLLEAAFGTQRRVQHPKQACDGAEQNDSRDAVSDRRIGCDRKFDCPEIQVDRSFAIHGYIHTRYPVDRAGL